MARPIHSWKRTSCEPTTGVAKRLFELRIDPVYMVQKFGRAGCFRAESVDLNLVSLTLALAACRRPGGKTTTIRTRSVRAVLADGARLRRRLTKDLSPPRRRSSPTSSICFLASSSRISTRFYSRARAKPRRSWRVHELKDEWSRSCLRSVPHRARMGRGGRRRSVRCPALERDGALFRRVVLFTCTSGRVLALAPGSRDYFTFSRPSLRIRRSPASSIASLRSRTPRHGVTHGPRGEGKVPHAADAVSVPEDGPRGDEAHAATPALENATVEARRAARRTRGDPSSPLSAPRGGAPRTPRGISRRRRSSRPRSRARTSRSAFDRVLGGSAILPGCGSARPPRVRRPNRRRRLRLGRSTAIDRRRRGLDRRVEAWRPVPGSRGSPRHPPGG